MHSPPLELSDLTDQLWPLTVNSRHHRLVRRHASLPHTTPPWRWVRIPWSGLLLSSTVSGSRKECLEEPRSYQEQRTLPSSPTYPTGQAGVGMRFCPYCLDQAPGEKHPSPPALQLPTPPTECAGWSCRAHGDHVMTLLTWLGQRGTEPKME